MLLKKKKIPKCIIDNIEISSDSNRENSDEESSNKETFDEENPDEENFDEINFDDENYKKIFIIFFSTYKNGK